ncbi:uncharacterized protein [Miscanthus floridulus]|uniref:uncharacterized protein isoform X2 n=1 Tax=Miscanthus floridulus TaxID=154761 RepID=UPI003457E958
MNKRVATCRRTECKAMVRLHRTSDHGWVISRFEMQHNHPCSATNGPNKQWPSHSDIDPMTKDVVRKLRENNRPIERVCTGQDDDTRTFPEAGGLSPSQMSDGLEEVLGTSGLDTVAPKEARPLCELERSLRIQRMATPVPVEMEQPPAATSGGTRVLRRRKWLLPTETEMDDGGRSSAPSACGTLAPAPQIFDRDLGSGRLSSCSPLPASVQRTMVADSLLAASEHHLPLSTATRQELTDLSRENEEMKAELGKLRSELNLFRSEAERVKKDQKHQCRDTYGRARAALRQLAGTRSR